MILVRMKITDKSMLLQALGNLKIIQFNSNSIKSSYFNTWIDAMDGGCPLRIQLSEESFEGIHDAQEFFQLLNLWASEGRNLPRGSEVLQHLAQGVTRVPHEVQETPTHDYIRPPTRETIWYMKNMSVSTLHTISFCTSQEDAGGRACGGRFWRPDSSDSWRWSPVSSSGSVQRTPSGCRHTSRQPD